MQSTDTGVFSPWRVARRLNPTQFERCPDAIRTREGFLELLPAQESFHRMWSCHAWHRDGTGLREARNTPGLWAAASIIWTHFSCTTLWGSVGRAVTVRGFPLPVLLISSSDFVFPWVALYLLGFYIFVFYTRNKGRGGLLCHGGQYPQQPPDCSLSHHLSEHLTCSGGRARWATEESVELPRLLPQAQSSFSHPHVAKLVYECPPQCSPSTVGAGLYSSHSPGVLWRPVWSLVK